MSSQAVEPPDQRISATSWAQTPKDVQVVVTALAAEVTRLREQANRSSRNSSQPPSQDSAEAKAARAQARHERRSGRQRGGQEGHAGKTRELLPVEQVDAVVKCKPSICVECGCLLLGEDSQPQRHQVTELPPVKAQVIEYQIHRLTCPCCQTVNVEPLPAGIGTSQFGPQLVSTLVLLMGRYRLSKRQVADWLETCCGVQLSPGSVVNIQEVVSQALAEPVAQLQRFIQDQPACNIDETSWRQGAQPRSAWLWTVVTPLASYFEIALSRSGEVARRLLDQCKGIVGSDRHSGYNWLPPMQRQVCWSHLLRDFQKILERDAISFPIGYHLQLQADYLLALWAQVRQGALPRASFDAELPAIQTHLQHWLLAGSRCQSSKTAETCHNLLALWDALWSFTRHPGVEPTNNSAERALRHPVIWRRLSYGTHSARGSIFVARILSAVETCRLQHRSCLDFIRQALVAFRAGLPPPSLLPLSASTIKT